MINLEPSTYVLVGLHLYGVEKSTFQVLLNKSLTPSPSPFKFIQLNINFLFVIITFRRYTASTKVGWCIKSQGDDFHWKNDQWCRSCRNGLG